MPANGAANNTKPSAPTLSKNPRKTRRMNPQLLVQPLAQYRTPASRKTPRHHNYLAHCQSRQFRVCQTPPSHPTPTPEPITHSSLLAHAFWTANAVVDPSTGTAMEYPQLKLGEDSKLWLAAASREIGCLAQGKQPDMPTGSNTVHFLDHRNLPAGCKATYLRIVATIKMHKVETHRIRFTAGGKVSTPTANLETIKILLNSTVSTPMQKCSLPTLKILTSARPWIATNTCASRQKTFRPTSWSSTTSLRLSTMAMSSPRFEKVCMAFHKPAS
jgi:hypothetical protein